MAALVITESIAKPLSLIGSGIASYIIKGKILRKKDWKVVLYESEEVVWTLYYQVVIWFTSIYFPYIALLQPVLLFIIFKAYYIFLMYFAKKPISQSNRDTTGVIIMFFLNLSMLVWLASFTIYLVIGFTHEQQLSNSDKLCGPFESMENWQQGLLDYIERIWVSSVYDFVFNYPASILTLICLFSLIKFRNDHFTLE